MKIAFITESNIQGKVPDTETNLRTDIMWMKMLDADHIPLYNLKAEDLAKYDVVLFIPPKGDPSSARLVETFNKYTDVIMIQEGPADYFFDYGMKEQLDFIAGIRASKGILCHNIGDKFFYSAITDKPIYPLHTAIDLKLLDGIRTFKKQNSAVLSGNMTRWYGGMNGFLAAKDLVSKIKIPTMGRRQRNEEAFLQTITKSKVKQIPYVDWLAYAKEIKDCKIGLNLMPTAAAGSFSVLCAALGIPCVGNWLLDTQRVCFGPELSMNAFQLSTARKTVKRLLQDKDYYNQMVDFGLKNAPFFDYKNVAIITTESIKKILEGVNDDVQ